MKHIAPASYARMLFVITAAFCTAAYTVAQTAEELIAKNIAAKGGLASIKAITRRRMTGKLEAQGIIILVGSEQKPDSLVRESSTVQGMTRVRAYDGKNGWQIDPFQGRRDPERMGEDDMRNMVENADFYGPLIDYTEKGSRVEFIGHASIEGDDALLLKVILKNGDIINIYLDPDTYLEFRTERLMYVRGSVRETFTNLGSYKKVNGVYFPFSIEWGSPRSPGDLSKLTIASIEVNMPLPDSEFTMPTAPPTPLVSAAHHVER